MTALPGVSTKNGGAAAGALRAGKVETRCTEKV